VNVLNSVFYEPFGPNGGWKWGNSTPSVPNTHTRVFDKDFRPTRVTSDLPASGPQPYFDKQVGWDNQSRVASITDVANSALSASYGFDALDRLTSATQGSNTWSYTFNGIGDRLTSTVNSASTNYSYFTSTHRLQTLSGAQSKSYTFDNAGNMTLDGTTSWTYAGNNRPLTAGSLNVLINALGQRVKKDNGSTTTRFVYDEAGRLWGEYDATGAMIQETVWLDDIPVATLRPNGTGTDVFYVHPDHLGSPRAATRPSDNQFTWKWDNTEPFGNSTPDQNPGGLGMFVYNLRFPGQYFDVETGKSYNHFRHYDSAIGRYVESDPLGLNAGLNTFAYVRGSPLSYVDEKGLCRVKGVWSKEPTFGVSSVNFKGISAGLELTGLGTLAFGRANFGVNGKVAWGISCTVYSDDQCPIIDVTNHTGNAPLSGGFGLPLGVNLPVALFGRGNGYAIVLALAAEHAGSAALEYGKLASQGLALVSKLRNDGPQALCEAVHGCSGYK
jgi:RHS repeat-associated protein